MLSEIKKAILAVMIEDLVAGTFDFTVKPSVKEIVNLGTVEISMDDIEMMTGSYMGNEGLDIPSRKEVECNVTTLIGSGYIKCRKHESIGRTTAIHRYHITEAGIKAGWEHYES